MKRGKLRSIIKKVLVGMILVFSLVTSSFTCKVWAKGGTPVYQLQESSIVYKENQGTGLEAFSCGAWSISNSIIKELQNEFGYVNRGIYESGFYNKRINDKSTLLEIGFLNNEYDRNNLVNHQEQYAAAIARGIINQLNKE